jgi:hypothetical protein
MALNTVNYIHRIKNMHAKLQKKMRNRTNSAPKAHLIIQHARLRGQHQPVALQLLAPNGLPPPEKDVAHVGLGRAKRVKDRLELGGEAFAAHHVLIEMN